MSKKKPNILVCPLDWGIGHATRCVPIINGLIRRDARVMVGASGRPVDFLRKSFPGLTFIDFKGYNIRYPANGNMAFKMFLSSGRILNEIHKEHRALENIIDEFKIDAVISDNRFGMWSEHIPCFYMTHQVMIKTPVYLKILEPLLLRLHRHFIDHYDELWIPDLEGELNLSGDLSHKYKLPQNTFFVGPLSRFSQVIPEKSGPRQKDHIKLLVMLSGPEPQRSILENILFNILKDFRERSVVLQGLPGEDVHFMLNEYVTVYSHLPDEQILRLITDSERIICRPGYSTIMDLAAMKRSAILVPTPGQTEQEYLAQNLSSKGLFRYVMQKELNSEILFNNKIPNAINTNYFHPDLLEARIDALFRNIYF